MPYVVAGVVAVLLLLAEQLRWQHLWYWVPATPWWVLRAAVEAGYALGLTLVFRTIPGLSDTPALFLGLIAGLAGPRVVGRPPIPIKGFNINLLNTAYTRLSRPLDREIDESSAEVERLYVNSEIRPRAREGKLVAEVFERAFREHLEGRHLMDEPEMLRGIGFIDKIMDDESADNEQKVAALVYRAYQIGAYSALRDLLKGLPRRRYGMKRSAGSIVSALRLRRRRRPRTPA